MLPLCCPHCRVPGLGPDPAESSGTVPDRLDCAACGASYPVLGGVPVLFEDSEILPAPRPSPAEAEALLRHFALPDDLLAVERLRALFARRAKFGGFLIEIEASQFLDRVRSGNEDDAAPPPPVALPSNSATGTPSYRWDLDYIPRVLPPWQALLANVRLRNTGAVTMRHEGTARVTLCSLWLTESGTPAGGEPERTPLPIDLPPGAAVTVPIKITVPPEPGRYRLRLTAVQEGVRWLNDDARHIRITVRAQPRPDVPPGWLVFGGEGPTEYQADHARATTMLLEWLARYTPPRPAVLEVGGNAFPMISDIPGDLFNVDVDLMGLQVGRMVLQKNAREMRVLCADAEDLPLPDASLDAVVMFATLHHFEDPARLLARLRAKLKPGGFIGVFCEPVGHIWPGKPDPAFLAELRKGVNEQSFTLWEYDHIFRRAGLRAAEVTVEANSLKARLVSA